MTTDGTKTEDPVILCARCKQTIAYEHGVRLCMSKSKRPMCETCLSTFPKVFVLELRPWSDWERSPAAIYRDIVPDVNWNGEDFFDLVEEGRPSDVEDEDAYMEECTERARDDYWQELKEAMNNDRCFACKPPSKWDKCTGNCLDYCNTVCYYSDKKKFVPQCLVCLDAYLPRSSDTKHCGIGPAFYVKCASPTKT